MLKTLKTKRVHGPIGVDAGRGGLRLVQLVRDERGLAIGQAAAWSQSLESDADGGALDFPELGQRLQRLIQLPFHGREVVCSLNLPEVELHLLELPGDGKLEAAALESAATWEIQRLTSVAPDELQAATWVLPGHRKSKSNMMGVATSRAHVAERLELARLARLTCVKVDVAACALARLVWELRERPVGEVWGILDVGADYSRLAICMDDVPVLVRGFEIGGRVWTAKIAQHLGLSHTAAERYKRDFGLPRGEIPDDLEAGAIEPPSAMVAGQDFAQVTADVLEEDLTRLKIETERSYEFVLQWGGDRVPGALLMVGGGARLPGLGDFFQEQLGVDVAPVSLWPSSTISRFEEGLRGIETLEVCALACGLSLQGMEPTCPA